MTDRGIGGTGERDSGGPRHSAFAIATVVVLGMGAACGVGAYIGSLPERVYLVPSTSIAAADGDVVEMEKAQIVSLWAWTHGGVDIDFGSVDCLHGVISRGGNDLLKVGDVIHLRARMYDKKLSPRTSFSCEMIGEKNQ